MSRLYLDRDKKLFVVLSYAGGTKYFRQLTQSKLKNFIEANVNSISPVQQSFDVIQIVREPMSRYMSWFDKQYIKPMYRGSDIKFRSWVNNLITKTWIDEYVSKAVHSCHYDGHTNFQSVWPKAQLPLKQDVNWKYLKMEDINPYFLSEERFELFRDPAEYVGVWEVLNPTAKNYLLDKIKEIYAVELKWYENLTFLLDN